MSGRAKNFAMTAICGILLLHCPIRLLSPPSLTNSRRTRFWGSLYRATCRVRNKTDSARCPPHFRQAGVRVAENRRKGRKAATVFSYLSTPLRVNYNGWKWLLFELAELAYNNVMFRRISAGFYGVQGRLKKPKTLSNGEKNAITRAIFCSANHRP